MIISQRVLDASQKLRYEAFMQFASEVSEARSIGSLTNVITANLKYVLNVYICRFLVIFENRKIIFEINRNQGQLYEQNPEIFAFELSTFIKNIPATYTKSEIIQQSEWANSLFNHEKVQFFYSFPISLRKYQKMVISIASKDTTPYTQTDYRFLKLIGELLLNKISELILLTHIEEKNKELANTNAELDALNAQIIDVNKNLENLVVLRTKELQKTNQELYTIFYRTSHDFRRPLSTILGLLQLAEENPDKNLMTDLFDKCRLEVGKLDRMLHKLGTISLNETEDEEIEVIDFEHLIQQIYKKYQINLHQQNIQFVYDIQIKRVFKASFELIFTILENVFENSIHYCDVNKKEKWITIQINEIDNDLVINILDNGQGIEEAIQNRIFEMYFRGNENSKGNGLGLYVAQKLVKNLKGKILIQSIPQQSTEIIIKLPFD